jgi:hypothetical protein
MNGLHITSLLATMLPMEVLIEKIHEECTNYLASTEDDKTKLLQSIEFTAMLITQKQAINDSGGVNNFIEKMDELKVAQKLFTPTQS